MNVSIRLTLQRLGDLFFFIKFMGQKKVETTTLLVIIYVFRKIVYRRRGNIPSINYKYPNTNCDEFVGLGGVKDCRTQPRVENGVNSTILHPYLSCRIMPGMGIYHRISIDMTGIFYLIIIQ